MAILLGAERVQQLRYSLHTKTNRWFEEQGKTKHFSCSFLFYISQSRGVAHQAVAVVSLLQFLLKYTHFRISIHLLFPYLWTTLLRKTKVQVFRILRIRLSAGKSFAQHPSIRVSPKKKQFFSLKILKMSEIEEDAATFFR